MHKNFLLNTDSYKTSHFLQYPPGTTTISSYIESRPVKNGDVNEIVFFGGQMLVQEYLMNPFTLQHLLEAKAHCAAHGVPFNEEGWRYILDEHNGYAPVQIDTLPEGSVTPPGLPLLQIRNTDPNVPWIVSHLETMLLRGIWYPSTVATHSREVKKIIKHYLDQTSDDPIGQLPFKLHDFGARGCTSNEQAGIGGVAHLVNFMGTDTLEGTRYAKHFYGEDMAGFSIPAAEHSTITSWGRNRELDAYANMLEAFPTGLVAVVSDSYDLYNAVDTLWGVELRDRVLKRDGVTVIRPDSGDPTEVVLKTLSLLGKNFGTYQNAKGFRVLNDKIRVIQGDGVTKEKIAEILQTMSGSGWSADNVAFGMGAGLLQHVNRDTLRFAMKASAIEIDGEWAEVYKDPITDPGKSSKRGIQHVLREGNGPFTVKTTTRPEQLWFDQLQPIYRKDVATDMPLFERTDFANIRARAAL